MFRCAPIRSGRLLASVLVAGICAVPLVAQLPASAPTSLTAPLSATPPQDSASARPRRATVTYVAGLLNVRANNSSLNSILREIARQTGMTITGGVADQRVFGNYGPAEPATVLATLLDGTGTNLFLKEAADNSPAELTLTPRTGSAAPPGPGSVRDEDVDDEPPQFPVPSNRVPLGFDNGAPGGNLRPQAGYGSGNPTATEQAPPTALQQAPPTAMQQVTGSQNTGGTGAAVGSPAAVPQPFNNVLGSPTAVSPSASTLPVTNSVPTDSLRTPSTAQPVSGIVDSPTGPPAGSTTEGYNAAAAANAASPNTPTNASPGGNTLPGSGNAAGSVRTPEQIFEQLQQLRRAAQAQGQNGAGQSSPASSANPNGQPSTPQ